MHLWISRKNTYRTFKLNAKSKDSTYKQNGERL